ncbi:hypothetical protein BCR35DRAFT_304558 [Leucosporidium creatinivorum]|uniref:Uncharacterized protein n=1 Tax=Leucosporidium creatinivorum TaxID=106004 RepID=A0A1Y2F770_9BASI|nr:hypothetical protein BCR35DRAFT_304558 [Leucosporidium creatinivorum]
MAALPALGTTYRSLEAFQLDVYQRCLQHSINLAINQSTPKRISLGCSLAGMTAGRAEFVCRCGIECRGEDGHFEVVLSNEEHNCGKERNKVNRAKARQKIGQRLAKLKEEMRGGKGKGKDRAREVQESSEEEEDSDSEDGSSDSGEGSSSEDEDRRRVTGSRWEGVYPSARGVQTETRQLCSIGPLSFPSPSESFPSAADLLVILYACCSQRNFSIYRYGGTTTSTSALLLCTLAHDRCRNNPQGLCPFKVQIEGKDGRWRVTEAEWGHNHETRSTSGTTVRASKEGWKRRESPARESPARKSSARKSPARKTRRRAVESESESEEEAEETDDDESEEEISTTPRKRGRPPSAASKAARRTTLLNHPKMSELKSQIDSLANGPPLSFPTSNNSIKTSTYTSLRVHILAAARQLGFSMILDHRRCSQRELDAGAFGMMCWKGHSRFGGAARDRCGMNLVIGKAADGSWSVLREAMEHNHELDEGVGAEELTTSVRDSKRPRTSAAANVAGPFSRPPPPKEKRRSRSPRPVVSTSGRQHTHSHSPSPFPPSHAQPPSPYAINTNNATTAVATAASPPPAPFIAQSHPFYLTLLTFLRSMNSSASLLPHAALLLAPAPQGGAIDSTERLVLLLSLSPEMLARFVDEELGDKLGLPRLQRALFKKAVGEARRRALGEGGGGGQAEGKLGEV